MDFNEFKGYYLAFVKIIRAIVILVYVSTEDNLFYFWVISSNSWIYLFRNFCFVCSMGCMKIFKISIFVTPNELNDNS
ncbi:hypothetical protein BpHYR1_027018 [Brachionus plicatilis]|uniref:Uncharacterized protein n=1 Tax=Brachionus plicatilis TaxID=10195 RepID=A0A3M7SPE1_BRAPC|nr:hypothetical protein BpHYR1_027018 [Brachionus plicatilis]